MCPRPFIPPAQQQRPGGVFGFPCSENLSQVKPLQPFPPPPPQWETVKNQEGYFQAEVVLASFNLSSL